MITEEQQKKDERYMRMALDEAQTAYEAGEIPIGAVVVCKDRVISRAHNLTETLCDVTAHAEMQAITAVPSDGPSCLASYMAVPTTNGATTTSRLMPCIPKPPSSVASWKRNVAN